MPSSGALPQTLQSITATKIDEVSKQRTSFEEYRTQVLQSAEKESNLREKVKILLDGVLRLEGISRYDEETEKKDEPPTFLTGGSLRNIKLFLRQSQHDSSVPQTLLKEWEDQLTQRLNIQSIKHQHAYFFRALVTEWLSNPESTASSGEGAATDEGSASFEQVGRKEMHEQRAEWENLVVDAKAIDSVAIEKCLSKLFMSTKASTKALETIRKEIKKSSDSLLADTAAFDAETMKWLIPGLIKSDLFSNEKVSILQEFSRNPEVATEVADVLQMRLRSLDTWKWNSDAIPLEMRRQLNGKYRVYMDEDVLDALFLHYLGIQGAVELKDDFGSFYSSPAWTRARKSIPKHDAERREYFLGDENDGSTEPKNRRAKYRAQVDLSSRDNVHEERQEMYESNYFMSLLPVEAEEGGRAYDSDSGDNEPKHKGPIETKHSLLHLLITESLIGTRLHGDFTVIRSDFKWFGPSLPHTTIFAVLRFLGVPQLWIEFFTRFLEAPLKFVHDGRDAETRIRKRGVAMSHTLSDVCSEAVLFCMDYAVNQHANGAYLYRLHDDFWFGGRNASAKRLGRP